jgi:hypothetical protein
MRLPGGLQPNNSMYNLSGVMLITYQWNVYNWFKFNVLKTAHGYNLN